MINILVAAQNRLLAHVWGDVFSRRGHVVSIVPDEVEAMAAIRSNQIRLVLTDIAGLPFEIKRHKPAPRVAFVVPQIVGVIPHVDIVLAHPLSPADLVRLTF